MTVCVIEILICFSFKGSFFKMENFFLFLYMTFMIYLPSWEHENIASAFIVNFIASYVCFLI